MKRRTFLSQMALVTTAMTSLPITALSVAETQSVTNQPKDTASDGALKTEWLARWEKNILGDSRNRYGDKETGEELGWRVSPFLNGFYFGFLATHEPKWIEKLIDWTDS